MRKNNNLNKEGKGIIDNLSNKVTYDCGFSIYPNPNKYNIIKEIRYNKIFITAIISLIIVILSIMLIYSQNQSLEDELNSLINELANNSYGWLINQSVDYTEAEASVNASIEGSAGILGVEFDYIVDPSWWNNSYYYRKNFSVQNQFMGSNLTDFPLFVYFNDSDLNKSMENGNDIRFADNNNNQLYFERENHSIINGRAIGYYWVRVNLTNTSNGATQIWIYYGNRTANAGANGENKFNTWDNNFISVWHFSDANWTGANNTKDSKGRNNGTSNAGVTQINGFIGKGASFDGIDDTINITANNMPIYKQNITVSCLANSTNSGIGDLISRWGSTGAGTWRSDWILNYETDSYKFYYIPAGNTWYYTGTKAANKNQWYYVAGTSNGSLIGILYVNSTTTNVGTQTGSSQDVSTSLAVIGAEWQQSGGVNTGYTRFFNGTLDECRVSNITRSSAWLSFEYNNIFQGDNELIWGSEEQPILYWVGKQNGNWSDASNWASSSGGAGGAGVPDSTITVIFDSANLNNSMINNSIAVYSINVSIGYNGTITQSMNWNLSINVTENVIISNGTFTHGDNSNAETWRVNLVVGGNFTLELGGKINVTGRGYDGQQGPGAGGSSIGGSYGGFGNSFSTGRTYGSITAPVNLGSGGYVSGGGVIILNVTENVIINGTISSDGTLGGTNNGGGSGGTINIQTRNLQGNGVISSIGKAGSGGSAKGGGGGRIAIVLTNGTDFSGFTGNITAYGGSYGSSSGAAGTFYKKTANQTYGQLIIDNNNLNPSSPVVTTYINDSTYTFDSINITNYGRLEVGKDAVLNLTSTTLTGDGNINSKLMINGSEVNQSNFIFPNIFNVSGFAISQKGTTGFTFNTSLVINNNSYITHEDNSNAESHKINLTILGNLTILSGGVINVSLLGYDSGQGPGAGGSSIGGSYGGIGGGVSKPSYGSVIYPVNLGSGGSYVGGGVVILNVSGTIIINGSIWAEGQGGASLGDNGGAGAGGTIYLILGSFQGSGIINAEGGDGTGGTSKGGGGGRIAIVLTNGTDFSGFTGNITAYGGSYGTGSGAAGTIYKKTASQTYGELIIDNNNLGATITTLISENVTDTVVGDVIITNKGFLSINSSSASGTGYYPISLTVYGNWNKTSTGNFSAGVNSTVTLAGGIGDNPLNTTFYSNESFYNLNITKRGGYVFFPAGWLMNVTGTFTVQGNSSNKAFLRSTVDGTQWKINASGANDADYVDVKDSNASAGNVINAYLDSVNSGNNNNWVFTNSTSDCMNLSSAGQTYVLTQNIINNTITADCIIVKNQNITLDCVGYSITSTQNYTGVYSNQWNTTVKNCNVSMGSGGDTNAIGIELTDAADNSNVINNTIVGEMDYGISFRPSNNGPENSLIENNTINVSASYANGTGIATTGIYLYTASNNTLRNNNVTTLAEYGIYLISSSNNNLTSNTGTSTSSIGIYLNSASNNTLISNTGTSNSSHGIQFYQSSNNTLIGNNGTSYSTSGSLISGIYIATSSTNNNFTNNYGSVIGGTSNGGITISSINNYLYNNTGVSVSTDGIIITSNGGNATLISNTGTSNSSSGISIGSSNNTLTSNTGTSNSSQGIYLYSSSNNNVLTSNTGTSTSSYGIYLQSSNNNTLINNTGTSNSSQGIYLYSSSNNNLTNNTFTSNSSYAVYLQSSNYNIIINQRAEGYLSGSRGFFIQISNHTIIKDCINVSGITNDVQYNGININNTFINCSYTLSKESVTAGSELIRKWYYRAYVNDSSGTAVSNANVSAYNVSGSQEFSSLMTNSSGWTNRTTITEYVNVGGTRQFYSNYNINATYGSSMANKTYNVTAVNGTGGINNNLNDVISFSNTSGVTSTCMNLTIAGLTYTLSSNIVNDTITADCIIVQAQNITLDCVGYSISSTQNYTGVYSNQWNTTVKNCNVSMGSGGNSNAIGIELTDAADFSSVINNTIIGEMDYGISFAPGNNGPENSLIENNTINVSASYANGTGIATTGIYLRAANNNTLRNNNATTLAEVGIYLQSSSNNILTSNTGTSNSSAGIYLQSSSNNNVLTSNTGTSNSSYGILLHSSSNNNLTSNTGTSTSGTDAYGIYIYSSSNNNVLTSNTGTSTSSVGIYLQSSSNTLTSNTGTSNSSYAVYLYSSNNNFLNNTRAEGYLSGSYGIAFRGANNNTIQDCINISGFSGDVLYVTTTSVNNTFINCSYRITGSSETVMAGGNLIRKWYYRAYVNDSSGTAVSNANVSAYNVSGSQEFGGLLTNSSGWTNITTITEYVNVGGTRVYYSNYNINATYGSSMANKTYNVTAVNGTGGINNNLNDVISFSNTSGVTSTCMNLTSAGTTYTLSANVINNTITNDCIIVKAQNVTLDCNGYYISSTQNFTGVYSNQWNTTVKNCNVSMGSGGDTNAIGIELTDAADNSNVINNTIIGEMDYGISFRPGNNGPENSLIENNTINVSASYANGTGIATTGIYLYTASNNTLRNNNATTLAEFGILLDSSSNNTLTSNTGASNSNIGIYLTSSSNNNLTSNTGISTSSDGIYLGVSSNNNVLTSNTGTSNSLQGIALSSSSNNTLTGNNGTSNSSYGIYLSSSSNNNTLTSNTGTSNSSYAVWLQNSNNNILTSNTGTSKTGSNAVGIYLSGSNNNTLTNNNASTIGGSYGAIYFYSASNNTLTNNTGTSNSSVGIYLQSSSNNNVLTSNTGTSNSSYAVYLLSSNNNFLNNTRAEGYLSGSRGIAFRDANNTIIQDCINVSGFSGDVLYVTATSSNNTFINCSYRITGTNETVMAGGDLIRKWYYRAYVNDSSGTAVSNANVSAYNVSGSQEFSGLLTNSSGWTNRTTITEYVNYGGTRVYYNNYTINANKSWNFPNSHSYNVSAVNGTGGINNKLDDVLTMNSALGNITIIYPLNTTIHYSSLIDFNVSISTGLSYPISACLYSLDNAANVSMTGFNATYFNYTYSGISHGYHNITFSCNDTTNNWNSASMNNFEVNLLDLNIANVTIPSPFYSNATLIIINVSNLGPPNATNVNVSCYLDNAIFDSKLIANITGADYYITNCTLTTSSGDSKSLNVTVDPNNAIPENNETNNNYIIIFNITQLSSIDAYDLENDTEDKTGWFANEQETLPDNMTYFFANYTMDNSSAIIAGANCNISFSGGSENNSLKYNMSYNSSALLYYYNRTFNYTGNYSWIINCSKNKYEPLIANSNISIRIPLYNQSSIGFATGKNTVNYNENVNLSVNIPSNDIDSGSIGYNISRVWVQINIPNGTIVNRTMSGECYDNETKILTLEEVDCNSVNCNDENVVCEIAEQSSDNNDIISLSQNGGSGAGSESDSEGKTRGVQQSTETAQYTEAITDNLEDNDNEKASSLNEEIAEQSSDNNGFSNLMHDEGGVDEEDKYSKYKYINISSYEEDKDNLSSVGIIMMPEENENDSVVLFIYSEFENLIIHNVNSSFSGKVIGKRFVVIGVSNNFIDFVVKNLSQDRVLFAGFINSSLAGRHEVRSIAHFIASKNSSTELYLMGVSSFSILFNSSICSGLGGNSSTGCQSISSQNSQSSSVTSLVFMNLSDMSFFINLITALANDSESNFMELFDLSNVSAMKIGNNNDYLSFSVENVSSESLDSENSRNAAYVVDNDIINLMYDEESRVSEREESRAREDGEAGTIKTTEALQTAEILTSDLEINEKKENYSYLTLTSGLDSSVLKNSVISSFVPTQVPEDTLPVSVSRIVIAATLKSPDSSDFIPIFIVKTYFAMSKDNNKDYLSFSVENYDNINSFSQDGESGVGRERESDYNNANSSRKCYIKKWKYFSELNGKEKVATLNNVSREMEWQMPSAYQEFDNSKLGGEMYKIETIDSDGKIGELVVSEKHKVYSSDHSLGKTLYPVDERINNLPLNVEESIELKNLVKVKCNSSIKGGCIFIDIIPSDSFFFLNNSRSIFQSRENSFFCELGEISCENFFNCNSSSEQFYYLPDHDSCAFEGKLAMADFAVCNNILINFSSHCKDINFDDFKKLSVKDFNLKEVKDVYSSLQNNLDNEIYFLNSKNEPVKVKSIEKVPYSGKIYDVDVPNDIILVERNGLIVWSGNSNGGIFNLTYNTSTLLGDYKITYYANLTNRFNVIKLVESNFSVQNTSITINSASSVNTTQTINVNGLIRRYNGSAVWNIPDNLFLMKLNNVTVSSDTLNHSSFTSGNGTNVNISSVVQLNLTSAGNVSSYSDDYSTNKYTTESYNYSNTGYYDVNGVVFESDLMASGGGNVTYKFNSVTKFYNASAYAGTQTNPSDPGGNTSLWYSYDNINYNIINSSTSSGVRIGGIVPVNNYNVFYIMIKSNNAGGLENPVTNLSIGYTQWEYNSSGNYNSGTINLPNVTYTILKWDRNLSGGEIKIQLRESDDNSTWGSWSSNYTNYLTNDISSFTKQYLQYRAWLSTANLSLTPVLYDVQLLYFNASTNSSGGYNYNITIPSNSLGVLPLEVSVVQNSLTGIIGLNISNITVWANTLAVYSYSPNYTGIIANYSVYINYTRVDTGELVNGTINVSISNSTGNWSRKCSGSSCVASWLVPNDLAYGNYTINISLSNMSAYYINSTLGYYDYLEEKNTTGNFYVANNTITNYNPSQEYNFNINATINNTGRASMNSIHVWAQDKHANIKNVSEITPCPRLYPNQSCNALMLVTINSGAGSGSKYITWRMNWSDNNGGVAGGDSYLQYISYAIISLNSNISISNSSVNRTIEHEKSDSFTFNVNSIGTDDVVNINITFNNETLSKSWVSINPNWTSGLAGGQSQTITINISVPSQTSPGNYSGIINVSSSNAGERYLNLTVSVPVNSSWYLTPSSNLSYNRSFSLNTAGEIGNYTIVNIGNINLTINLSYSPGRTTDYSVKPGLFSTGNANGTNPVKLNATKGGNATISLYHNGWDSESLNDVGVIVKIYNETASPSAKYFEDAFWIAEQVPNVTNIYFILDGISGNKSELNKNLTIKVRATDDINLNETATTINVTYSGTTSVLNASSLCSVFGECTGSSGARTIANFSVNFTPSSATSHNVKAVVYDTKTGGRQQYISSTYTFTAYGTTTLGLNANFSSITIRNININNKANFYANFTMNNTGEVYAYASELNFSGNSSIIINNYTVGNLASGANASYVAQINISELTPSGIYNLTGTLRWRNPDNTYSTTSVIIGINVSSNKSFALNPSSLNLTVNSNSQNSTILTINNTGNDLLVSMNLNCYTQTLCPSFTITYNESSFNISSNAVKQVNITLTAGSGLSGGLYLGIINISERNISNTINIQADVPSSYSFSVSPTSVNSSKAISQAGTISEITISNTGNMNITLSLNSTNSSIITPNVSSIEVPISSNRTFMINYTTPSEEGSYLEKIRVTNSSATITQINVTVNLTATRVNITILYPTSSINISNVTTGKIIEIHANVTYGDTLITSNSSFTAVIGGSSCSNVNYSYIANNYWNITCTAPSLTDGRSYNLTVTLTHDVYGQVSQISVNSIIYRDITSPSFNFTRNHINKGGNINISVNISDNVNIKNVSAVLTYPNSSIINLSLILSNGFYINTSLVLNDAGEYLINISANDTTGNFNSTLEWFEVYNRYYWNLKLLDYNLNSVNNINITLTRVNLSTILIENLTTSNGAADFYVNKRFYDIHALISGDELIARNVNFSNLSESGMSLNFHRISSGDLAETVSLHKSFQGLASNSSNLSNNAVNIIFNYSAASYDNSNELEVVKCSNWNYSSRACSGSWSVATSSINKEARTVSGNSTGFSSYFLAEDKCGNGACEVSYGETTSTCSADCKETTITVSGGGGGGGGGGLSTGDLQRIEDIVKSFLNIGGVKLETTSIYKELFAGETTTVRIKLKNTLSKPNTIKMSATGDVKDMLFFEKSEIDLKASEERDVLIKIIAPKTIEPGNYDGDLVLSSGKEQGKIPVTIRILSPEGKLLDIKIQPLVNTIAPGKVLRIQTDLLNLGKTKKVDVQFDLQLLDVNTGDIITRTEEAFAVETTISTVKNLTIPEYTKPGKYMIKGTAYYSNVEQSNMQASSIAYINVQYPLYARKFLGVHLWVYFLFIAIAGIGFGLFIYGRWLQYQKKRFKVKIDMTKLPQAGAHSGFIGKVAETAIRTFVDLNKLQMHTLVAGATGGGKTVAAQDLIEAALLNKKSVIVFDPTAQWTGFFRKCDDKGMLKRYLYFDMKIKDARGFNGIIKTIHDPYELINIEKYLNKPGEITIFNISHLSPKDIDMVVASTIQQIFKSEPEESKELKTLIVYDEVHRLLPKFGGSGQGFIQLERGVREFRKWGIGLVLISQVLSDFIGEIKANIGTEIQMGTRYEGDLERVNMKYGEDVLKSVVKEPIGTGMVVNAEYNSGRPYFVAFKPLLHSIRRLSNEELSKYEKYFDEIEDLEYQNEQLKKLNIDTLDLELELKLARDKVKEGQFQMADMYLDTLRPNFEEQWKKAGKKPVHLVKERIKKAEVEEGIEKAKKEREKYLKKNPEETLPLGEEIKGLKKELEEKKKKGNDVSKVEIKINDLEARLKPFNGKIPSKDAEGIKEEIDELKKEAGKI